MMNITNASRAITATFARVSKLELEVEKAFTVGSVDTFGTDAGELDTEGWMDVVMWSIQN